MTYLQQFENSFPPPFNIGPGPSQARTGVFFLKDSSNVKAENVHFLAEDASVSYLRLNLNA